MLSDSKASRKVFLSISTLTHSYCRINSECMEEKEVQRVFQALERAIGFDCKGDSDKVVMGLKALGNIGLYDRVIPNLNRCIRDKSLSMEVRLAAVDAFRRMPCGFDVSMQHVVFSSFYKYIFCKWKGHQKSPNQCKRNFKFFKK